MNNLTVYSAPWCGPCKLLKPLLEAFEDKLNITYVDVDESPEKAREALVRGVPTLILSDEGGDFLDRKTGSMTEGDLKTFLRIGK